MNANFLKYRENYRCDLKSFDKIENNVNITSKFNSSILMTN